MYIRILKILFHGSCNACFKDKYGKYVKKFWTENGSTKCNLESN